MVTLLMINIYFLCLIALTKNINARNSRMQDRTTIQREELPGRCGVVGCDSNGGCPVFLDDVLASRLRGFDNEVLVLIYFCDIDRLRTTIVGGEYHVHEVVGGVDVKGLVVPGVAIHFLCGCNLLAWPIAVELRVAVAVPDVIVHASPIEFVAHIDGGGGCLVTTLRRYPLEKS